MAFLHKYEVGGQSFFLVSDSPSKPGGQQFTISSEDWKGRVSPKEVKNMQTVIKQLKQLSFDTSEEKVVEALDKVASDLQADGREDLALILDQISDRLEGRN